jgi:endonuclease/exonuclease/phosphatase family metal-dependent hydrolase
VNSVLTDFTKNELSWRISDHYPLWAEFGLG